MGSESTTPKVAVALTDAEFRAEVTRLLGDTEVAVRTLPSADWDKIDEIDAEVLIVRRGDVRSAAARRALRRLADQDDAPAIVVLSGRADAAETASLFAKGAAGVLPKDAAPDQIRTAVETIANAAADGGLTGPETGGSGAEPRLADFLSHSPCMREFLSLVERVAGSDSSLLVTGETGVGKEHLARAIHAESERAEKPFVSVNCGALPENLLESELFGHTKGAFTGADADRRGRFEQAGGGTIFLDEVGELPNALQVKLLTVLQRREVRPLGSEEPRSVDVRVMAATNRDLAADVTEGRFREDLFYRLNVVPLVVPPLRQRPEDLPDLVGRFMNFFRAQLDRDDVRDITPDAMDALVRHDWPGNVREVLNVIERAMLLCRGDRITLADLPESMGGLSPSLTVEPDDPVDALPLPEDWRTRHLAELKKEVVAAFEHRYLSALLTQTAGKVGATAELAGITPRSLYEKMRRLGLKKEDFKAGA